MKYASVFPLAIVAATTAAQAEPIATLTGMSGPVLVNTGEGFLPANPDKPVALNVGDRVLLRDGALATVAYAACDVPLTKPTLHVVTPDPACGSKAALPDSYIVTPASASSEALAAEALVVGQVLSAALVVGAGVILVDGLTDDDDDDPASPN